VFALSFSEASLLQTSEIKTLFEEIKNDHNAAAGIFDTRVLPK
jgi:hypothetical protein